MPDLGRWAGATTPFERWLLVFGFAAQALFMARWLIQWLASERRGESHVPLPFWWCSLAGASLLAVYYALRGEPVGLLGQCFGWTVYARNLVMIRRRAARAAASWRSSKRTSIWRAPASSTPGARPSRRRRARNGSCW